MKNNTKSPITDNLLRQPGQSLDEEIQKLIDDRMLPYILASAFMIFTAFLEWYRWYTETPPIPLLFSLMAVLMIAYSFYKIVPIRRKIKAMRQGSEGEKAVAELLNQFREDKMRVLHDVVGDNFNLDHVVISTKGVYLIETKTYSKPESGKAEIVFNGKTIIKNGQDLGDDILIQVKAANKWLSDLIEELTAKKFEVQSAVVFPGWFVQMQNAFNSDIWVVNPKNLNSFIQKQKESLSQEDVKLISNHLNRYVRGSQK